MVSTHESIEISTDESVKREMTIIENSRTIRSYDCAFCKRGFTNAQALGGHMNIHRKDKATVKKLHESTVARKACEYFSPISSEQARFYAALRSNTSFEINATSLNTHCPRSYKPQRVSNRNFTTPYGDFMESNLSLKLGCTISEEKRDEIKREEHGNRNWFGNEHVDLELRLGQNPYFVCDDHECSC